MNLQEYLNAPIPRKTALAISIGQSIGMTAIALYNMRRMAAEANTVISDQHERLTIYSETTEFLLLRADDATLQELNTNLDFWRVIRASRSEEKE